MSKDRRDDMILYSNYPGVMNLDDSWCLFLTNIDILIGFRAWKIAFPFQKRPGVLIIFRAGRW